MGRMIIAYGTKLYLTRDTNSLCAVLKPISLTTRGTYVISLTCQTLRMAEEASSWDALQCVQSVAWGT